jgi:hypothetical protein
MNPYESLCLTDPVSGVQVWVNRERKRHRSDGPAVVYTNGTTEWWVSGKLHRTDGPAIEYRTGGCIWYVQGRRFTEEEFNLYVDQLTGEVLVPIGKKLYFDK